jgi:hypothetical protein
MAEQSIPVTGDMVRAILSGRQTQMRRIIKVQPDAIHDGEPYWHIGGYRAYAFRGINDPLRMGTHNPLRCPYGRPGDILWLKEAWRPFEDEALGTCIQYRADNGLFKPSLWSNDQGAWCEAHAEYKDWKRSILMPRWASRIQLRVKSVGVERLQEITNDDARAEGPEYAHLHRHGTEGLEWEPHPGEIVRDPYAGRHNTGVHDCWICAFRRIWQIHNGIGSWDANPWVWRIEFELIEAQ